MRAEVIITSVFGLVFAAVGVALIVDAWTADAAVTPERRRRVRPERHRGGEAMVGFGVLAGAAAFLGRDAWRYSIVVAIGGAVLLLVGGWLNRVFLDAAVRNRGVLRRGYRPKGPRKPDDPPPMRIR